MRWIALVMISSARSLLPACITDWLHLLCQMFLFPQATKSMDLGFDGKHLIAMQGPFSKELNVAMLRQTEADYFVTKESGKTGGFEEKYEAAMETGTDNTLA